MPPIEVAFFCVQKKEPMAYRSSKSNFRVRNVIPHIPSENHLWMFQMAMQKFGVTDFKSYFRKLAVPIALCAVVGAVVGAGMYGRWGVLWGTVAGVAAPAGIVYAVVSLGLILIYLASFFAAWVLIIYAARWFLHQ
jgi:hypothetical protein